MDTTVTRRQVLSMGLALTALSLSEQRVFAFGDTIVKNGEFPGMFALVKNNGNRGSGIKVASNVVITAGHVVYSAKNPVQGINLYPNLSRGTRAIKAANWTVHPGYPAASARYAVEARAWNKLPENIRKRTTWSDVPENTPEKIQWRKWLSAMRARGSVDIGVMRTESAIPGAVMRLALPPRALVAEMQEDRGRHNGLTSPAMVRKAYLEFKKLVEQPGVRHIGVGYGVISCKDYDTDNLQKRKCKQDSNARQGAVEISIIEAMVEFPRKGLVIGMRNPVGGDQPPNRFGDSGGPLLQVSDSSSIVIGVNVETSSTLSFASTFYDPSVALFLLEQIPELFIV